MGNGRISFDPIPFVYLVEPIIGQPHNAIIRASPHLRLTGTAMAPGPAWKRVSALSGGHCSCDSHLTSVHPYVVIWCSSLQTKPISLHARRRNPAVLPVSLNESEFTTTSFMRLTCKHDFLSWFLLDAGHQATAAWPAPRDARPVWGRRSFAKPTGASHVRRGLSTRPQSRGCVLAAAFVGCRGGRSTLPRAGAAHHALILFV